MACISTGKAVTLFTGNYKFLKLPKSIKGGTKLIFIITGIYEFMTMDLPVMLIE